MSAVQSTARKPPGRRTMRPGGETAPDSFRMLRNLGLAALAGRIPANKPVTPAKIARLAGVSDQTARDAIEAGAELYGLTGGAA